MFKMLQMYMNNLEIEKFNELALKNNIILSKEELNFSYSFIKKNWEVYINNPNSLNLDKYKNHYTEENFIKIKKLYAQLFNKYSKFL